MITFSDPMIHVNTDTLNAEYIHQLLVDHLPLFSMASQADINGKHILFTHAGIVESWWKKYFPDTPTDVASVCNALNAKMSNIETLGAFIDDALMDISKRRGGESRSRFMLVGRLGRTQEVEANQRNLSGLRTYTAEEESRYQKIFRRLGLP